MSSGSFSGRGASLYALAASFMATTVFALSLSVNPPVAQAHAGVHRGAAVADRAAAGLHPFGTVLMGRRTTQVEPAQRIATTKPATSKTRPARSVPAAAAATTPSNAATTPTPSRVPPPAPPKNESGGSAPPSAAANPSPPTTAGAPAVRALWQWYTGLIVSAPQTLLSFAAAHQVNVIYLQVNQSIPQTSYAAFIQAAGQHGVKVVACSGAPTWGTRAGQGQLLSFVSWVGQYNGAHPSAPFAGINLDIEPYQLPAWTSSQATVVSQWMANVDAAVALAARSRLAVSAAVPFWLDTIPAAGAGEPLGLWMAQHTQQLVIMAYRNAAAGVIAVAAAELKDGAQVGRPVVVAVDTTNSGPTTSFSGDTQPELATALSAVARNLAATPAFAGWAVNDYTAWSQMAP